MKKQIITIADDLEKGKIDESEAQELLTHLFKTFNSLTYEEHPILIGYLNTDFGYNGFDKIEKGTPVFFYRNLYFFEIKNTNNGVISKQMFYKENLEPYVDKI